ncbi:serine/threonine protein phosphatase [Xinfangfangia sp. D13-10-4-6]|uniref:metallophosphoesterase n=1 Tax=Pseudogemmobacter hezensis TaxID=2737662 RepID=UPI00155641D5|nr:metallophosphoesterase [Pseudogemmobacter hezensis]NPD14483.1 serine/threonine protein phosphatase [Pseudogemmobacter hezensis]
MRSYAIGDIHGHLDLLQRAHERIARDMAQHGAAPVIHLGDLPDRGPDSRGVIEWLKNGIERGEDWVVLKGNHDRLFNRFIGDPWWSDPGLSRPYTWLHPAVGGAATLRSYGVRNAADRPVEVVHRDALAAVDPAHLAFLEARPTSLLRGDVFFVHAGIRPGIALQDQAEDDLVWIRKGFLDDSRDHGPLIVHGHTALDQPTHFGNRVDIDSSAAYGGPLTAVAIEGREVFLLTDQGRVPLLPEAG